MANNRMFLVHRPTGLAVYLGKRMAWGWYGAPADMGNQITLLYRVLKDEFGHEGGQDAFQVAMESPDGEQIGVWDSWTERQTRPDGLLLLLTKGEHS